MSNLLRPIVTITFVEFDETIADSSDPRGPTEPRPCHALLCNELNWDGIMGCRGDSDGFDRTLEWNHRI